CFKEWRHYLQGGKHQVTVLTDHENLKWFMTTKRLSPRQARWALFFSEFSFVLTHRPGSRNGKADLMSRRDDYEPTNDNHNMIQLLRPEQVISLCTVELQEDKLIKALGLEFYELRDWPLLIAEFLLTDKWNDEISIETLELCKEELE